MASAEPRAPPVLQRRLLARHLEMIAIGGTIGTGLFIGSGATIAYSGPLGALTGFAVVGVLVYFVTTALGELAAHIPVSGSFVSYAGRFVDPALAFTLGWNYWFQWAISLPSELTAAGIIMQFWLPDIPAWIWSASILALLVCIHLIGVQGFGETEYWLSMIKVIAIVAFIISGILIDLGLIGNGPMLGISYWSIEGAPFKGGLHNLVKVFIIAFFGFGGTELIGLTAGEAVDPHKTIPRAVKRTFWRILLFYFISVFIIGIVIPNNDPSLLDAEKSDNITISPFTLVFSRVGLSFASHIMNGVILSAVLSASSSAMYAASRTLMSMANEGNAPAVFGVISSRGVPLYSIAITTLFGCLSLLGIVWGQNFVFEWLIGVTGISGILTWISITVIHIRFRAALAAQNVPVTTLLYRAPFFPAGSYIAIVLGLTIIVAQAYTSVTADPFEIRHVFGVYAGIPLFLAVYFGYRYIKKTSFVSLETCDVSPSMVSSLPQHRDALSEGASRDHRRVGPNTSTDQVTLCPGTPQRSSLEGGACSTDDQGISDSDCRMPNSHTDSSIDTTVILMSKDQQAYQPPPAASD